MATVFFYPCCFITNLELDLNSIPDVISTWPSLFAFYRILDNLPVAVPRYRRDGSQAPSYEHGFRVGYKVSYHT